MRVLDLGAGKVDIAHRIWPDAEVVTVDLDPTAKPDVLADVRELPEDLGEFDAILASHILEHLGRLEAAPTIEHWASFLKDEGEMHIIVPDLEWAAEHLLETPSVPVQLIMHIYGSQYAEGEYHKMGYTALLLRGVLHKAGLKVQMLRDNEYDIHISGEDPYMASQLYALAVKR